MKSEVHLKYVVLDRTADIKVTLCSSLPYLRGLNSQQMI